MFNRLLVAILLLLTVFTAVPASAQNATSQNTNQKGMLQLNCSDDNTACAWTVVMFVPANIYEIEWYFGDATPSVKEINPSHDYAKSGIYSITADIKYNCKADGQFICDTTSITQLHSERTRPTTVASAIADGRKAGSWILYTVLGAIAAIAVIFSINVVVK